MSFWRKIVVKTVWRVRELALLKNSLLMWEKISEVFSEYTSVEGKVFFLDQSYLFAKRSHYLLQNLIL